MKDFDKTIFKILQFYWSRLNGRDFDPHSNELQIMFEMFKNKHMQWKKTETRNEKKNCVTVNSVEYNLLDTNWNSFNDLMTDIFSAFSR